MRKAGDFAGLVRLLYQERFPEAQASWVEGLLRLLVELRRVFGNDLDKVMILSAIGQRALLDQSLPTRPYEQWINAPIVDRHRRATNIDALARATDIPRESVRRKVNELIADDLVVRDAAKRLTIAPGAAGRLVGSTEVTIAMLDALIASYLALLSELGAVEVRRP